MFNFITVLNHIFLADRVLIRRSFGWNFLSDMKLNKARPQQTRFSFYLVRLAQLPPNPRSGSVAYPNSKKKTQDVARRQGENKTERKQRRPRKKPNLSQVSHIRTVLLGPPKLSLAALKRLFRAPLFFAPQAGKSSRLCKGKAAAMSDAQVVFLELACINYVGNSAIGTKALRMCFLSRCSFLTHLGSWANPERNRRDREARQQHRE